MEATNAQKTKSLAVETSTFSANRSQPKLALTETNNEWDDFDTHSTWVAVFQVVYVVAIWPFMMMILSPICVLGYAIVR